MRNKDVLTLCAPESPTFKVEWADLPNLKCPLYGLLKIDEYLEGKIDAHALSLALLEIQDPGMDDSLRYIIGGPLGRLHDRLQEAEVDSSIRQWTLDRYEKLQKEIEDFYNQTITDDDKRFRQELLDLYELYMGKDKQHQSPAHELAKLTYIRDYVTKHLSPDGKALLARQGVLYPNQEGFFLYRQARRRAEFLEDYSERESTRVDVGDLQAAKDFFFREFELFIQMLADYNPEAADELVGHISTYDPDDESYLDVLALHLCVVGNDMKPQGEITDPVTFFRLNGRRNWLYSLNTFVRQCVEGELKPRHYGDINKDIDFLRNKPHVLCFMDVADFVNFPLIQESSFILSQAPQLVMQWMVLQGLISWEFLEEYLPIQENQAFAIKNNVSRGLELFLASPRGFGQVKAQQLGHIPTRNENVTNFTVPKFEIVAKRRAPDIDSLSFASVREYEGFAEWRRVPRTVPESASESSVFKLVCHVPLRVRIWEHEGRVRYVCNLPYCGKKYQMNWQTAELYAANELIPADTYELWKTKAGHTVVIFNDDLSQDQINRLKSGVKFSELDFRENKNNVVVPDATLLYLAPDKKKLQTLAFILENLGWPTRLIEVLQSAVSLVEALTLVGYVFSYRSEELVKNIEHISPLGSINEIVYGRNDTDPETRQLFTELRPYVIGWVGSRLPTICFEAANIAEIVARFLCGKEISEYFMVTPVSSRLTVYDGKIDARKMYFGGAHADYRSTVLNEIVDLSPQDEIDKHTEAMIMRNARLFS
jgi:hypothetical protein